MRLADKKASLSSSDDLQKPISSRRSQIDRGKKAVLEVTWALIDEMAGVDFPLTRVSDGAGVALRTIYNWFDDRDGLISEAIRLKHQSLVEDLVPPDVTSFEISRGLLILDRIAAETCRSRGWSTTAAQLFFSSAASPAIVDTLSRFPRSFIQCWYNSAEADPQRLERLGKENVLNSHVALQWSVINDWACGRIEDDELAGKLRDAFLFVCFALASDHGMTAIKEASR